MARSSGLLARVAGCALTLSLALTRVAHAEGTESSLPMVEYALSNGMRVILEEDHRQPLVAIRMSYAAGSAQDPDGRPRLAQIVQFLTARHLSTLPTQPFALLQHAGASEITSSTGFDETYYAATVTSGALELALWSEQDRLSSVAEFSDFKLRVVERVVAPLVHETSTTGTPPVPRGLMAAVLGQEDATASHVSVTVGDARAFFEASYRPDNAQLVLVGDFQIATARELVKRYFGFVKNPSVPRVSREASRAIPIGKHLSLPSEDAAGWAAMTWRGRASSVRERAQQEVLLALLKQGMERAATLGRQDQASARSSVQLSSAGPNNLLVVHLSSGVSPALVRGKMEEEFARLARGVTADEVARVRHRVLIGWLASWERLSQRATFLADISKIAGRPITAAEYVAELEAVNERDVAALAKTFTPTELTEVDWLPRGSETAASP